MSIEKGTTVKIVSKGNTGDHGFYIGDTVVTTGLDWPYNTPRGAWQQFRREDQLCQYLLPEHYEVTEQTVTVEGGIEPEIVPTKSVYAVVNTEDEIYATTADREYARELKAALGGKRKGVRIFQYAAVKEIR